MRTYKVWGSASSRRWSHQRSQDRVPFTLINNRIIITTFNNYTYVEETVQRRATGTTNKIINWEDRDENLCRVQKIPNSLQKILLRTRSTTKQEGSWRDCFGPQRTSSGTRDHW